MEFFKSCLYLFVIFFTVQSKSVDNLDTYFDKKCEEYYKDVTLDTTYPHMVQLGYERTGKNKYRCVGSLISENLVLTSGFCVDNIKPIFVRLGTNNFVANPTHVQEYDISKQILHPDYVKNKRNDLAILLLKDKVKLNEHTRPICFRSDIDESKSKLIGTGWGKPNRETEPADDLKTIELERFPNDKCNEKYVKQKELNFTTEFCAVTKVEGIDICIGDGGGPIQVKHPNYENANLQVGITWYGPSLCGKRDFPSVYIYVPSYLSWIKEVIESNAS